MAGLLLDVTRLLYRRMRGRLPTGIDRVGLEYVRHFAPRARAVLSYAGGAAVLSQRLSGRAFASLGAAANAAPLPGSILLNTGHHGLQHARYAAALRRRGARTVVFLHDLIPIEYPQYCRRGEHERHAARARNALGFARGIIVNSRDTLERLRAFAAAAHLACPPALVAPLASSLAPHPPGARPLAEPYFVVLGTIEPRKNHRLLLDVWARLGSRAPRLVVIGQRGWLCDDVLERLEQSHPLVIRSERCSDADLATWLHHARALLMPSHAEGYGLPVAEALAAGVPVIASDLPVFHETAGEVPEYAPSSHVERWSELVAAYALEPSTLRAAQLERMKRYRPTSWTQHFCAVESFLTSI